MPNTNSAFEIVVRGWNADPSERSDLGPTSAEITINVGRFCATEVEDITAKTVRNTVRVSAMLLATWLLDNWWRLRWEPFRQLDLPKERLLDWEFSHSLPSVGAGYVWPPVTLASDGANILVTCIAGAGDEYPDLVPIRYLNSFSERVPAADFEATVGAFVEAVIARLDSNGLRHTVLHELWRETNDERKQPSQGFRRRLEALLGLDPDSDAQLVSALISNWTGRIGQDALAEVAAATDAVRIVGMLSKAEEVSESTSMFADTYDIDDLRESLAGMSKTMDQPWVLGRYAAYKLRDRWGFGFGAITTAAFADRLKLPLHALEDVYVSAPFSLGVGGFSESKMKFILKRPHEQSRRFDIARLIGDRLAANSNDIWHPATKGYTFRQEVQRAFAAELLCPSEELVRRFDAPIELDGIDDVVAETAKEYCVSDRLVLTHLVNRGLAPDFLLEESDVTSYREFLSRMAVARSLTTFVS